MPKYDSILNKCQMWFGNRFDESVLIDWLLLHRWWFHSASVLIMKKSKSSVIITTSSREKKTLNSVGRGFIYCVSRDSDVNETPIIYLSFSRHTVNLQITIKSRVAANTIILQSKACVSVSKKWGKIHQLGICYDGRKRHHQSRKHKLFSWTTDHLMRTLLGYT